MAELVTSGHIVDAILAMVLLEALLVFVHHRRTGRGPALRQVLANLLAGAFLLLALRAALGAAGWIWIAAFLAASLPAHLVDLWCRRRP
jgi:hypothetical protein